jgi:alkaline phosphatase
LYLAHEVIEFEKAVRIAQNYAKSKGNVQLIVTADHETGGFSINSYTFSTDLPSQTDDLETLRTKREARANETSVAWTTTDHTSTQVHLFGLGPNSEKIQNASHHIDTFTIISEIMQDFASGSSGSTTYRSSETTMTEDHDFDFTWLYVSGLVVAAIGIFWKAHTYKIKKSNGSNQIPNEKT